MSALLGVAMAVVFGALAVAAATLRRGGDAPARRLVVVALLGAVVGAAGGFAGRALELVPVATSLADGTGEPWPGRAAALVVAYAVIAGACLVLAVRGDAVAGPSSGVAYGLAFALGGFLASPLVELLRGRAGVRETLAGAALGATLGAVFGAFAGATRLRASWPAKAGLVAGGAVAAAAAAFGVAAVFVAVSGTTAAKASAVIAAALAVVAAAAAGSWLVERRVVREELADEASLGVLPAEFAPSVASHRWFGGAGWWPRRDERWAIVGLLTQLAYRKRQLRQLEGERASIYSLEVGRLRERARRALAASTAVAEPGDRRA